MGGKHGQAVWCKSTRVSLFHEVVLLVVLFVLTPFAVFAAGNTTAAGVVTATPGKGTLSVAAPYSDDDNSDNSLLIEWGLNGVDFSLGSQNSTHSASPYAYDITGLTNGVAYQLRVTYQDGDGGTDLIQTLTDLTPYDSMVHSSLSTESTRWTGSGGWGVAAGKYGEFTCATCHEKGTDNIKQVKVLLTAPNGTDQLPIELAISPNDEVTFASAEDGSSDLGDDTGGHSSSVKICEACHSLTDYHRYDTTSDPDGGGPLTAQAVLTHYNNSDCINCHAHSNGFAHGGSGSGCNTCHGKDADNGGAGTTQSHSTHTENDTDDQRGPYLACTVCHDTNNYPYFVSGTDADSDGKFSLAETDVCDTCHSAGGTYDGVDDATIGAKANWSSGIYSGDDITAGKEKWCASCHDESPAVASSVTAPNVIGDENGAYTYGTGWGYYKTGHGVDAASTYPASGGITAGAGAACDGCHDYSAAHIDGEPRTYSSGSDNYQAGYRLKSINGWPPMNIPRENGVPLDSDDFMLCFSSGCHDSNIYLNQPATTTGFRDDVGEGRDSGDTPPINAHEYHLDNIGVRFDSDWTGGSDSQPTCTTCHNVHGSTQLSMVRDGALKGGSGMIVYYVDSGHVMNSVSPPSPTNVTLNNSIGTAFNESSTGNLCSVCHGGNYSYYYRSAPGAQQAPTLDWTGETNYVTDGVDPNSGDGGDYYTFRVKYTDANYQIPKSIQVWVDEDDSGTYEAGEKYDLLAVDSSDDDVSDGKLYRRILNLSRAGDGTLTYRFYATDGPDAATGDPTHATNNTVTIANNAPTLAWTGETGYESDGVNPGSGASGGSFTFRVSYTDTDNEVPTSIQVWIDRNDDGDYLDASEKLDLIEVDSGDTYYADGKLYSLAVVLTNAGDGNLNYLFYAGDGTAAASGQPTGALSVSVTAANSAPTLAWTNETGYVGNGVDPDSDVGDATFSFRVKYADADNNAPSTIQVWVDKNDDDDFADAGETIDLIAVDGTDLDYTDGKLYAGSTTVSEAGDGIISYQFYASDGSLDATGDPTVSSFLTILMSAIKVSCAGTGTYDYTTIQDAIDNATNGDTILVADGTCTERITIDNKDLTIKSVNGSASTTINGSAGGTVITLTNGADTVFEGFTITNGYLSSGYGAGVSISSSSPALDDCVITANDSSRAAAVYLTGSGATLTLTNSTVSNNTGSLDNPGVYLSSGTSATISDTTFSNNSTTNGAGGAIYMTSSVDASLTVSGATFDTNTSTSYGGAIYVYLGGGTVTVDIDNSTFNGNSAPRGGAIYMNDNGATSSSLTITDSLIASNSSSIEGGALYLKNIDATTVTGSTISGNSSQTGGALLYSNASANTLTMTDCTISDNNVNGGSYGGALRMAGGVSLFERCIFTGNIAPSRGGVAYISGSAGATADTTLKNCLVTGNESTSFEGGGFYVTDDGNSAHTVTILNSTFSGNYAGSYGGGLYVGSTTAATAKNSIFWRNRAGTSSYEISGTLSASYSDIRQSGYEGNNNINTDPLFINDVSYSLAPTSSGNYHLLLSSPAIDLGTATGAPSDDVDGNLRPLGNGVDMGADEVISVANNAPTLGWTGESGYTGDGVDPDSAASATSFTFRADYADADNHVAGAIEVWVDEDDSGSYEAGEKYAMTEVDGGDTDVTDGKLYSKALTLSYSGDGALNYRFYANDSIEVATGAAVDDSVLVINDAPTLGWLGSGNYTADGVHPDSAASGSSFEFRVTFTDSNGHLPSAIQLWIDANDDGDYLDSGEKLTMAEYLSTDTDTTDGKDYFRLVTLTATGDNTFNYRFYASDGDVATGTPTSDSTVSLVNNAPSLAWIGSGNFTSDGVHPNNAVGGSSYEFQVSYTDADNQAPSAIQVWIDKNDDGDYLDANEKLTMTEVDGGDTTYTDGKQYTHSLTLSYISGDGYLNYLFYASDGTAAATGSPTSALQAGVFAANNAPDLDWTGETNYTADGVNPDSGAEGDTFTFRVKYTDIENSAPTSIQVWVDLDDDGTSVGDEGTELLTMTEVDAGDTVYDDGKLYTKDVVINNAGDGTLLYNFVASDGTDGATGNATANQTITMTAPISVCSSGCDYTSIQAAITASTNGDFIMVKDGTYAENITFSGKLVTVYSQNGAATTSITGTGSNAPVVTFNSSETSSAVLDGFTIDNSGNSSLTRGIYIDGATPIIKNSTIENNDAPNATNGGAGIYINNAAPTLDTCVIRANSTLNRTGGGITIVGAAGGATITGSTIGGDTAADQNYSNNGKGGAIYFSGSTTGTLTITNSSIKNNLAATDGGGIHLLNITNETVITGSTISYNTSNGGYGGGIYASNAPVRLDNCTLDYNKIPTTRSGGGIYLTGASSALTIENNSTVSNNIGTVDRIGYGAAIYITGSTATTPLSISDTVIDSNLATSGGGAIYMNALTNTSTFNNVTISNNSTSNGHGGGIYASTASLTITNSTFDNNDTPNTKNGGGLYLATATATITSTTFTNSYSGYGGGISIGGTSPTLNLEKVKLQGNSAYNGGGGVHVGAGTATINNSLITGNNVDTDYRYGGGIANSGTLNLYNSTIAGNYVRRDGGGIQAGGTETIRNCIIYGNIADLGTIPSIRSTAETVEYSDVEGSYAGTGNIDTDPLFTNLQQAGQGAPSLTGDFSLQSTSTCIDTAGATNAPTDDIDGIARPNDIAGKGDGVDDYDMGAYEYTP